MEINWMDVSVLCRVTSFDSEFGFSQIVEASDDESARFL